MTKKYEFIQLTIVAEQVLSAISEGIIYRREIEDHIKAPEKSVLRALEKLEHYGMINIKNSKSPGRAGRGLRLYHCEITDIGGAMLVVCDMMKARAAKTL